MKKTLALLLICLACVPSVLAADGAGFSDVAQADWFYAPVSLCSQLGIIAGYPDGTFRPQAAISRAEFCKLLVGGLVDEAEILAALIAGRPWYAPYTDYVVERGLADGGLDWQAPIPRSEVAYMICTHQGEAPAPIERRLAELVLDFDDVPPEHREAVLSMMALGIMTGDTGGAFRPQGSLTRAEAAAVMARLMGVGATPVAIPDLPVDGLKAAETSRQIITVTTDSLEDFEARVNVYEQVDGVWLRRWRDLPAVCGSRGLMANRKQNSLRSPVGNFGIVFAFGAQADPGVHPGLEYRAITPESYWVLDSSSPLYNRWTEGRGDFKDREHLESFGYQYDYALVLDFNYERPVKGDGGAIFIHVATHDGKGTAGCIGLQQSDLLDIMGWLDPGHNPRVIVCPEGDLSDF